MFKLRPAGGNALGDGGTNRIPHERRNDNPTQRLTAPDWRNVEFTYFNQIKSAMETRSPTAAPLRSLPQYNSNPAYQISVLGALYPEVTICQVVASLASRRKQTASAHIHFNKR
jgi:hypothetical protein